MMKSNQEYRQEAKILFIKIMLRALARFAADGYTLGE